MQRELHDDVEIKRDLEQPCGNSSLRPSCLGQIMLPKAHKARLVPLTRSILSRKARQNLPSPIVQAGATTGMPPTKRKQRPG